MGPAASAALAVVFGLPDAPDGGACCPGVSAGDLGGDEYSDGGLLCAEGAL